MKAVNVQPEDASNKDVNATSEDPTIAKIEWDSASNAYKLTLVKAGSTTIDWKSSDGGAEKTQAVTVSAPAAPSESTGSEASGSTEATDESSHADESSSTPADSSTN